MSCIFCVTPNAPKLIMYIASDMNLSAQINVNANDK